MQARRSTERRTSNEGGRRNALVLAGLPLPFLFGRPSAAMVPVLASAFSS